MKQPRAKSFLAISALVSLMTSGGCSPSSTLRGPSSVDMDYSAFMTDGGYVANDTQELENQIEPFLKAHADPAHAYNPRDLRGYFSERQKDTDLYGAIDTVYLLYTMGILDSHTTEDGRSEWASVIEGFQNPDTGYFDRGNFTWQSKNHATAYAAGALKILGARPKFPFKFAADIFSDRRHVEQWLDGFNWALIWSGSHQIGDAIALRMFPDGVSVPADWSQWVLESLNEKVNADTGMWQRGIPIPFPRWPTTMALGGASHFWWFYESLGEPFKSPRKIVDSILTLQKKNAIWGDVLMNGKYPQCIDLDAVNGMRFAFRQLSIEDQKSYGPRIISALEKYSRAASSILNTPGALEKTYRRSHKLPGAILGLAEANTFYSELTGHPLLHTQNVWRTVLPGIPWL